MFTQTKKSFASNTQQWINLAQVDAADAIKHLQTLLKEGGLLAFADDNGFAMFQSEKVMVGEECYNDYTPETGPNQGKRSTSLRRSCSSKKADSGASRPLVNFKTPDGLEGSIWGGFSLNIPVDPKD